MKVSDPYCRECLDKTKIRMLINTLRMTEGEAKILVRGLKNTNKQD